MNKAINAYKKSSIESNVAYSSPHKLIDLLLTAGIDNISKAIGFMKRNEIAKKGEHLSKALDIVQALQQSLSKDDNDIKNNLSDLYTFSVESLMRGNLNSDEELLLSVVNVLKSIREGWRTIPNEMRGEKSNGIISSSISENSGL